MKKLLVILSAMLMIVAVSCSNDTPAAPSAGLDGTDITITVPSVDEDNVAPPVEAYIVTELVNQVMNITRTGEVSGTYESVYFENGYDADGNKTYAVDEEGSYIIAVDCGLLKVGDEVTNFDINNETITVNGREYMNSDTAAAYCADLDKLLNELTVRSVTSSETSGTARRIKVHVPVLDEEGNLSYETVEGETVPQVVVETVSMTFDYLLQTSSIDSTMANGSSKVEDISKVTVDLREPVMGISSVACYSSTVSSGGADLRTYVIEFTRDGETSTYAYY